MFKKLMLVAVALGGGMIVSGLAHGQGPHRYGHGYGYGRHHDHARLHDHLAHNEFHRQLEHREAHRYPMTPWQHGRLHDHLDHSRFHDQVLHHQYHRYHRGHVPNYYHSRYPYSNPHRHSGFGIGVLPYGFSLQIGR